MDRHKRTRLDLSVLIIPALLFAACAGQGPASASPAAVSPSPAAASPSGSAASPSAAAFDWMKYSGTQITFLANQHPWTDGMTPLLAEFTQQTGIKVNVQPFSEDLYFDKMEQNLRSTTNSADVYFLPMDSTGFDQFSAHLIEPLTPYVNDPAKTASDYDLKDFPQGFLQPGTYPPGDATAQLYGIPISFETYILFYNKDLVNQYLGGTVPATFEDLMKAAADITKSAGSKGISGAVMRGIRSDAIMDTLSGVVWNAWGATDAPPPYGLWFNGGWDKPRLTDAKVCQGLTNYAKMLAAGPSNRFAIDWPDANTLFSQGKTAFFIDASLFGPAYEDTTKSQVAGKVGYAVLPPVAGGDGKSYTGHWLWGLGIPKNSKNKDAAWYFVQWMTNKQNTSRIGTATGGAPRLSSYSDPTYTGKLNADYIKTVNQAMQTSRTTVVFKAGWKDGALAIVDGMLAIAQGKDPTASCAKANDALGKVVK
ncbi:MAG: sugar ABC transporter substrate-binding protein [Chloroflexi bacterium]|nr:MAG: sugar ABC transporter substrate-binding protein [Chloroflexota bacterium]